MQGLPLELFNIIHSRLFRNRQRRVSLKADSKFFIQNLFSLILFFFCYLTSSATHNRAGEITYRHVSGNNCLTYEITITTYTKTSSCPPACRPSLDSVHMGDGSIVQFLRSNGTG